MGWRPWPVYEKHFNFSDNPFTIAPNPRYLYLTGRHREALAHLTYGLQENGGFILLTGEVGTGKTTVCRCLLERVPEHVHLALVLTPTLGGNELLEAICDEFSVGHDKGATNKTLTDALNRYLLDIHAQGQRAVVMIDEAQNLDIEVLEQLRLLTNLETNEQKLLQIILIGQPEFLAKLDQPELRQLSQRIVARFHLTPLKTGEVRAYINHRLKIAGGSTAIFSKAVILRIAQLSKGVPRLINLLCDRALLGCYVQDKHEVDMKTLEQAAREVFGDRRSVADERQALRFRSRRPWLLSAGGAAAGAAVAAGLFVFAEVPLVDWLKQLPLPRTDVVEIAGRTPEALPSPVMAIAEPPPPVAEQQLVVGRDQGQDQARDQSPLSWQTLTSEEYGESGAYLALFDLWQVEFSADAPRAPCSFASENQLDCWYKRGKFRDLQRLNRPALLKFVSDEGRLFYATLLAIEGRNLRLGVGARTMETTRNQMEKYWTQEFMLLWRRPPGFVRTIRPGDRGSVVVWVKEKISRLEGRKVTAGFSEVYDFGLVSRVRSLQRRCGLQVDGLVGRETIIMINGLISGVPVLSRNVNRRCTRQLNV